MVTPAESWKVARSHWPSDRIMAIQTLVDKVNRTTDAARRAVLNAELDREVQDHTVYSFVARAALAALR